MASSHLFVSWCELSDWEEFSWAGSFNAASLARFLVLISVKVVMVHVLRIELSMASVSVQVVATVGDEVPAGFRLVGKKHVRSIMPSQPAPHSLREMPRVTLFGLVKPVCHGTVEPFGMRRDLLRELAF